MRRKTYLTTALIGALVTLLSPAHASAQTATYTALATLPGNDPVYGTIVEGNDGNYYVAGQTGIYRVTPAGAVTQIADLGSTSSPVQGKTYGNLVIGIDTWLYGNFDTGIYWIHTNGTSLEQIFGYPAPSRAASVKSYTSMAGGGTGSGTVYTLLNDDSANSYLYGLTSPGQGNLICTIPDVLANGVIQGSDGNLYGTTSDAENAIFFRCTTNGTYTKLHTFGGSTNTAEGSGGYGQLVEGPDHNFYGTNQDLGIDSGGTIYKVTPAGAVTVLSSFPGGAEGEEPASGLTLGSDGNFYGVTAGGGAGAGVFYQITPKGKYTELADFPSGVNTDFNSLVQGSDGNFYGATDGGEVYKLTMSSALPAPVAMQMSPASVPLGQSAELSWSLLNAYSMTAQQCFAYGTGPNWFGAEAASGTQSVTPLSAGSYTFALSCGGVESNVVTLAVTNVTETELEASPNPVPTGSQVTLTATVAETAGSSVPTGEVKFFYGGILLGSNALNSKGIVTLTASSAGIPPGSYNLTAHYNGDSGNAPSDSDGTAVAVTKSASTTALTASPNPVPVSHDATLMATVTSTTGAAEPTGSVVFRVGGFTLATVTLSNGVASFTASDAGIAAGKYPVTANYSGDAFNRPSTSPAVTVTVQ